MNRLIKIYLNIGLIIIGFFISLVVQGATYEDGIAAYNTGDDAKSYIILKPLADAGDAKAQNMVGFLFVMGIGVDTSEEQATIYYRMAAEQGLANAQENLARQYHLGRGVEKSDQLAIEWYKKAVSQGSETAATSLAKIQPPILPKGFSIYSKIPDKNDTLTQTQVNQLVNDGYIEYKAANYLGALNLWIKAAKAGDAEAQTNISIQYSYAIGTTKNKDKALQWLNKALAQKYHKAYAFTGKLHLNGLLYPESKLKAFEFFQEAANLGDINSLFNLGSISEDWGDLNSAMNYYKQAAEKGHARSQATLGLIFEGKLDSFQKQNYVSVDLEESMKWYLKAAQNNFHYAIYTVGHNYSIGRGVEKSLAKATYWFKKCARMGGQECVVSLSKEEQLAVKDEIYQLALTQANQGDAKAQYNLAQAYKYGNGVEKSASQTEYWLAKSSEQDYSEAMVDLAAIYANRNAITKSANLYRKLAKNTREPRAVVSRAIGYYQTGDYDLAFELAKPYADIGNKFAQNIVGTMYKFGRGVATSKEQARNYFTKASAATQDILQQSVISEAQNNLGFLYEYSFNSSQKAAFWYEKAAQSEHPVALSALARLYSIGDGVVQDQNKAIALYARAEAAGHEMAAIYKSAAQGEQRIEQHRLNQIKLKAAKAKIKQMDKQAYQQTQQNTALVSTYIRTYTYPKKKKKFWSWDSFLSHAANPQNTRGNYALDGWQPKPAPGWKPNHLEVYKHNLDIQIERASRGFNKY